MAGLDLPPTVRVDPRTAQLIAVREALQDLSGQATAIAEQAAEDAEAAHEAAKAGASPFAASVARKLTSHPVGGRCEVAPGGRRGSVRYVGCAGGIQSVLVAVELDSPQGPDTQVGGRWIDGQEYFKPFRPDVQGIVWKSPAEVVCGDFPEEDPFAGLSDSDEG
eukprot:TRINITY_DN44186_c0_g1_i1.p1 TRINITY_DN44186_c0_g1~~TRINITY_DN44186_c0_g1_i1.p1  ORF type:complete len:164 (-),score=29.92 TRINITY_DN44186_c0_g1_i1:251-742(-)